MGRTAALLGSVSVMGVALAAPASEHQARRAEAPVVVDGVIDQAEWDGATRIAEFMQFEPTVGAPALQSTEVLILYDDAFVYFGFRCFESEPSKITAQLNRRDSDLLTDDAVIVVLDTFHDSRSAYYFATNLLATQLDGRINDNGRVVETAWDSTWFSAAKRFDEGWTAEIAIPLMYLRFRPGEDQTWGLNVGRTTRRLLETSFSSGPLDHRFRVSQFGTLTNLDLRSAQRKYQVVPYALGAAQEGRDPDGQVGVDVWFSPTPSQTVNVTVNPDFAIIEADQEQINLTRFELALAEKRPFFLEDSERYRQRIRTFYTRRIGDIKAGGKYLGRTGSWQYSFLSAQSDPTSSASTFATDPSAESGNYAVGRVEKDLWKGSTLGLMASNRNLSGENRGSVGLDASLFFTNTFRFTGQLIRSHGPEEGGNMAFFVRPSYDTSTTHLHFRYTHLGDRFGDHVNAIGFIRDDDRREMDSAFERQFWFTEGAFERIAYDSNYNIYWSQLGALRSWQIDQGLRIDFRNRFSIGWGFQEEFKGEDDVLFEQDFRNREHSFLLGYNIREFQSMQVTYHFGRNFGSDFELLGAAIRRQISEGFNVEYELSRLWLSPDPEGRSTYIHVLRAVQNFTPDLFVRVFFQTNSAIDRKNVQAVFVWRYKPPFGTIQLAYERGTAAFGERSEQGNTFFVKLSYVI